MIPYILSFIVSLGYVGLKSTQQLNVVHKQYRWILPVSLLMAVCEVFITSSIVKNGGSLGYLTLAIGLGGGVGSMSATWLHSKFLQGE